tara:strand:- start:21979 stop:22110 length:132 start_codon:yes stop_codon:yes gene_type:complete
MLKLRNNKSEKDNKLEQKVYFLEKKVDRILEKLEQILFILHKD